MLFGFQPAVQLGYRLDTAAMLIAFRFTTKLKSFFWQQLQHSEASRHLTGSAQLKQHVCGAHCAEACALACRMELRK